MSFDYPEYKTSSPDWYLLLKENARKNRMKMTEAEACLWEALRNIPRPYKFRRQHIIGDYIADFACLTKMLVIEIDGGYHTTDEQKHYDEMRTESLERMGFTVIRFTNEEVMSNRQNVIETIKEFIYK